MKYRISTLLILIALIALVVHEFSTIVESDVELTFTLVSSVSNSQSLQIQYQLVSFDHTEWDDNRDRLKQLWRRSKNESGLEAFPDLVDLDPDQRQFTVSAKKFRSPILRRELGIVLDYNLVDLKIEGPEFGRLTNATIGLHVDQTELNIDWLFANVMQ